MYTNFGVLIPNLMSVFDDIFLLKMTFSAEKGQAFFPILFTVHCDITVLIESKKIGNEIFKESNSLAGAVL